MVGSPTTLLNQSAVASSTARVYWRIIRKRKWLIAAIVTLITGLSFGWTMSRPRYYQAVATVVIDPQAPKVMPNSTDVVELGGGYLGNKEYLTTQVRIIKSRWLAREVVREHPQLLADRDLIRGAKPDASQEELTDHVIDYLLRGIRVLPVRDSRIFGIGVMDRNPQRAAELANYISAVYIEQNRAVKIAATHDAKRWVARQLDDARKELERSETELHNYKKQHNILSVNLQERQDLISKALEDFSNARTETRKKRIDLETHRFALNALIESDPAVAPSTFAAQSPTLTALRGAYLEEKRKLASLSDKYGAKWPEVVVQESRTNSTLADLRNEGKAMLRAVDAEIRSLVAAEARYTAEVDKLTSEALEVNQREIEFRQLSRATTNAEQVFTALLKRLNESGLQEQDLANNIRPLDTAEVPTEAAEPRVRRNIAFGFMIGVILAMALAFLVELADRTVKSQEDVEVGLGLPFLGLVPSVAEASSKRGAPVPATAMRELHVAQHPSSAAAECLRVVRTNILFCSAARPLNRLLVTSANPLEGKTVTVVNLGAVMAQSGQRTLIIDTDMRRPRLHKVLGMSNEHGISRLILGEDDLDAAIKSTDVPKLSVMTCGPLPPNPAELLQTERFASIVDRLAERFDRLIFDSPPILAVTDAAVLSRVLDGVVLVARAGRVTHDALIRARSHLGAVNAHVVGVILNDVDLANPHYTEYYGYGSRYYGHEPAVSPAPSDV